MIAVWNDAIKKYKSHYSLTITQTHAMLVHGLPQECGQSVAGGKTKKRGPRHALSWTLRTRTGPRFLLSIFHDLSLFAARRDALSSSSLFFSISLSFSLFLAAATSGSFDYRVWLSLYQLSFSLPPSLSLSLSLSAILSYRYSDFTIGVYLKPGCACRYVAGSLISRGDWGHATMCTMYTRMCPMGIPSEERSEATPVRSADWTTGEANEGCSVPCAPYSPCCSHPFDHSLSLSLSLILPFSSSIEHPSSRLLSLLRAHFLVPRASLPRDAYNPLYATPSSPSYNSIRMQHRKAQESTMRSYDPAPWLRGDYPRPFLSLTRESSTRFRSSSHGDGILNRRDFVYRYSYRWNHECGIA